MLDYHAARGVAGRDGSLGLGLVYAFMRCHQSISKSQIVFGLHKPNNENGNNKKPAITTGKKGVPERRSFGHQPFLPAR